MNITDEPGPASPAFLLHARRAPQGRLTLSAIVVATGLALVSVRGAADESGAMDFRVGVQPVLKEFCFDCHGDGANNGGIAFDQFPSDQALLENHDLWLKALKNLRAGLMPPPKKDQPSPDQKQKIERWIKSAVFRSDPQKPDPGRVTVRRLNRVEYRNTIRDLLGVDFDTEKEFPPDDSGHGFDNIGDVLTLPPMLLEKYLAAAKTIVTRAVPIVPGVPAEHIISGQSFRAEGQNQSDAAGRGPLALSYYQRTNVTASFKAAHRGRYQLVLDFTATERFVDNQFDLNKCRLVFRADGVELHNREYTREGTKAFRFEFDQDWSAGEHHFTLEIEPLTPDQRQVRSLSLRFDSVTVRGPIDEKHYVRPKNYARFFPRDTPTDGLERRRYARELLGSFARKAYRRPVDERTADRLADLAEATCSQPGQTFESGVAQAMVAVLASPRFLFREENPEPGEKESTSAWVDEYSLASRLSYFLWSSMPDEELLELAATRQLRRNLTAQIQRLLKDPKAEGLSRNFVGQWLQARDIESVTIDARQVLAREAAVDPDQDRRRRRSAELREKPEESLTPAEKKELADLRASFFRGFGRAPRAELTTELRRSMRQETEKTFEYVLQQDRSLLELLDSDYTFLNERLARHYGLTNLNVLGDELRRVTLPPDSARGGILTHGTILAVTSNPTRTSPVKRGLFILDNILGTPPPPPPPDIPTLEDAARGVASRPLSLRETLALHREKPLCSSCHDRMDPLGLALENFNAMGMWREQERSQPIDATGRLVSGEDFKGIKELRRILVTEHAAEFYHTITEKLLTYALGRGLEYYDVDTVDQIVDRLKKSGGRPSSLLLAIIESAPFQKTRRLDFAATSGTQPKPVELRAQSH